MRRLCGIAVLWVGAAAGQDMAVTAIRSPTSGCALGAAEPVAVRLFNYGTTLPAGTTMNVSYTINAGIPLTQLLVLGSTLLKNSTLDYVFPATANLSVPGTYSISATVSLAGDINPANNSTLAPDIRNWAPSVGGTINGPVGPTLSGTLSLAGYTGDVLEWQESDDGGHRWRRLSNTSATQAFALLREHTGFRALVDNGLCAPALSATQLVMSSDPIFYHGFEP